MGIFDRTDLACEAYSAGEKLPEGVDVTRYQRGNVRIEKMKVDENASEIIGKPCGNYATFFSERFSLLDSQTRAELSSLLSEELEKSAVDMTGKEIKGDFSVLTVGLGNIGMTPDAVGPETVSKLNATSHISKERPELFEKLGCVKLSALAPGVEGQTGIDTYEIISSVAANVKPDLIIAVDALAARNCDRLASTLQISDVGISPGSGVGNRRKELSKNTLGVPVIAIGVPTVVDSSALVKDALERSGINELSDKMTEILENGRRFFVAPKDCDEITRSAATLIAESINKTFGVGEL